MDPTAAIVVDDRDRNDQKDANDQSTMRVSSPVARDRRQATGARDDERRDQGVAPGPWMIFFEAPRVRAVDEANSPPNVAGNRREQDCPARADRKSDEQGDNPFDRQGASFLAGRRCESSLARSSASVAANSQERRSDGSTLSRSRSTARSSANQSLAGSTGAGSSRVSRPATSVARRPLVGVLNCS